VNLTFGYLALDAPLASAISYFSQWAMSVVFVGKQGMAFFPNINRLFNF
jgi:hypothetical protein